MSQAPKVNRGGKPPRRYVPAALKDTPTSAARKAEAAEQHAEMQILQWDRLLRHVPWVAQQSMQLNPGSSRAISRLRHSPKYVARTKKVIRPRVKKHGEEETPDNSSTDKKE